MENRKLIILLSLFLSLTFVGRAFAYEVGTHEFLTKETISFYNEHLSENKIPKEFEDDLISGSNHEDDSVRWMNHFYDPVYNRGLTLPGNWLSSKEWARNDVYQTSITYNPIMRTTIADLLAVTNPGALRTTDYTWERAIKDYLRGDKERAFRGLGQVLHLIEDASVPDHTRNDPHPAFNSKDILETGSPYEIWTGNFNLNNPDKGLASRLFNKKPIILTDLNAYFDGMATYSNNNFYSKDTIGIGEYKSPEPDYFGQDGSYTYGFKKDLVFGDYKLLRGRGLFIWTSKKSNSIDYPEIISDYWSRLSVRAVQHGAGVVDLFFKEVEKAKTDPNFVIKEEKSLMAQAVETVGNFVGNLFGRKTEDGLKLAAEILLDNSVNQNQLEENNSIAEENSSSAVSDKNLTSAPGSNIRTGIAVDEQGEDADPTNAKRAAGKQELVNSGLQQTATNLNSAVSVGVGQAYSASSGQAGQGEATQKQCVYNVSQTPKREKLILNEIAWMGGPVSANDEWLELKNISGGELDISGWQILDKDEQIKVTLKNGLKLTAGGFLLLERANDDVVPNIAADLIYNAVGNGTPSLRNSNEGLRLFDKECNLVDEVLANPDWPAGESATRKTMERSADLSWHTYTGDGETHSTGSGQVLIFGTPKKENGSASPSAASSGLNGSPQVVPEPSSPLKILISEVQISGITAKDEFIELYNPNDEAVDLAGWSVKRKSSSGTEYSLVAASRLEDKTIPAKGYFLLAHESDYGGSVIPDATWAPSNSIASDNTVLLYAPDGNVMDKLGFGAAGDFETSAYPSNPDANQGLYRKTETDTDNNSVDFAISASTPKNSGTYGGFLVFESGPEVKKIFSAAHLVISEIYPDRTGANRDFVELYNPYATGTPDIDISGWSLQVLSANATSTEKIAKKNFEAGNKIPSRGFFLIGIEDYPSGDMNWASGSLNSTTGATIFLVSGTTTISDFEDSSIVDKIAYGTGSGLLVPETQAAPLPAVGQSLERKSWQNENCVSAQNSGEFLGNGCDADNNESDFEVRPTPNPQGRNNLLEPREALLVPENFTAEYSSSTLEITLNWDGATSTKYFLSYGTTSPATLKPLAEVAAATTYSFRIREVGVNYYFDISVKDSEGLASSATTTLNVPSPLTNLYFYKDTRSIDSKNYLFDLYYNSYPFIPNVYNNYNEHSGRILVFYLNGESPTEPVLNTANNFRPANLSNVLGVVYPRCAGDGPNSIGSPGFSLILPGGCGNGGGVENRTLSIGMLEDLHLLLKLATTMDSVTFTDQDFVTVGMYAFNQSGRGSQGYGLAALDRNKYFFQNETPAHQPPQLSGELELDFNKEKSQLETKWQKATDPDTLDHLLIYEINYSTTTEFMNWNWQKSNWNTKDRKQVVSGDDFLIGVRAKDIFGNYSDILTAEWAYPETIFYVEQNQMNSWSRAFGDKNPNCSGCPNFASYQSFRAEEDLEFNLVSLRVRHEVGGNSADLRLAIYPIINNAPDLNSLIAETQLKGVNHPDPNSDLTFTFDEPLELMAGKKYWLILDIENYNDHRAWFRNRWQNAINTGVYLYDGGQAGMGPGEICDSPWCSSYGPSTHIPFPDATADWYMKIGLAEDF